MPADATTFYLAFTAVFAGLGFFLLRLDRNLRAMEQRVEALEATRASDPEARPGGEAPA